MLTIGNPKQYARAAEKNSERLFPYYAGYSESFTDQLLKSAQLDGNAIVLDPWNGSGTTISSAGRLGLKAIGIDLNPAMVIVAKASLLSSREAPSLLPLAKSIVAQVTKHSRCLIESDPLSTWFYDESASLIRGLEVEINRALVSDDDYCSLTKQNTLNRLSPLAAFFYVALFRSVRSMLFSFIPTNPTWVKQPRTSQERKRPIWDSVEKVFLTQVGFLTESMLALRENRNRESNEHVNVRLGSATGLRLKNGSIDFILSSPPYCTRIDYAVSTAIELAILRYDDHSFDGLRRSLMGTATVEPTAPVIEAVWGRRCKQFLRQLYRHKSKASKSYYYKSHVQYFDSLFKSIQEIARVLKPRGNCVLVVQDSYYKELHNDLPMMAVEMADNSALKLFRREDFVSKKSMVGRNYRAKKYLETRLSSESVLCFRR